jgi:VWFA-related protein
MMVPRALALLMVASATLPSLSGRAQTPTQTPQPVFRATTDLVTIDVAVRSGGTPVGGLGPKDFVLLDNNVRQTVDVVELEAVPVDITVLIDATEDDASNVNDLVSQAKKIAALARPTDRVRVMRVSNYVSDLVPLQQAATMPEVPAIAGTGIPAAHDGLAAALLRQVDPDRRHLIIAITNGIDAISALDAATVRELARRSTATLYIEQVDVALEPMSEPPRYIGSRERRERDRCGASGVCTPPRPYWRPFDDEQFDVLKDAAEATGGELYVPGIFTNRTASAVFEKAFEDYRRTYLLRFTPQGVARDGWHDVTVTIPAYPALEIKARRGYALDAGTKAPGTAGVPTPGPTAAAGPAAATAPRPASALLALDDLVAAYGAGHYAAAVEGLERHPRLGDLFRDLERTGSPWPGNPHREAAFVLELAHAGLQSQSRPLRDAAVQLLDNERKLIRDPLGLTPDPYERYWNWTAVMVLDAANQQGAALAFVDKAVERFPDEPRFVLARAFLSDQRRAFDTLATSGPSLSFVQSVAELYDKAIAFDATANEGRLRKARLLHRAGFEVDSLRLLDAMHDDPQDAGLTYLRHLFRAQTLDGLQRYADATAEYRVAMSLAPDAQSARVGLMIGSLRQGDRASAETLAEGIQSAPADTMDPWWGYWLGDYRFYPNAIQRLREQQP